jgi:hypothetical protein
MMGEALTSNAGNDIDVKMQGMPASNAIKIERGRCCHIRNTCQ